MNKEKVFEAIDTLKYALDNADGKLRRLRVECFKAQSYTQILRVDKIVIMINVLQEALEHFYSEDFNDLEEISV